MRASTCVEAARPTRLPPRYVAAAAEDNSSWFFSIPNSEFERVMRGVYTQREGTVPRRRRGGEAAAAPPDALAHLSAQLSQRGTSRVV